MKIEEGKFYRTRDGRKVGPMGFFGGERYQFRGVVGGENNARTWCGDGRYVATGPCHDFDLIAEWTDEPTFDPLDPPAFGELTDAQKVDIMLHEARCGGLEVWHGGSGKWLARSDVGRPIWESEARYRKKPQPVRDTVTLNVDGDGFIEGSVSFADKGIHTHRITFDTIDGKPVCDSIKMEVL